eukprot:jgi/Astpho2/9055/Aster-02714
MKGVLCDKGKLTYSLDVPPPKLSDGQVLISVKATAVNGADLIQKAGSYPGPPGASELLGLECAGVVTDVGKGVTKFKKGDRVMALLDGGGYAEQAVAPEGFIMHIPDRLGFEEAAGIPETFITAYLELIMLGQLKKGQSVLIHAGASGVGCAAIQIAKQVGATIYTTSSTKEKLDECKKLGADVLINYKEENFSEIVRSKANPDAVLEAVPGGPVKVPGANVILDLVGASHFQGNIDCLTIEGRLLLVGMPGGSEAKINLGQVLQKRAQIIGSTLRARPKAQKCDIVQRFWDFAEPHFRSSAFHPKLDQTYKLSQVNDAIGRMQEKKNAGKIIMVVD